MTSDKEKEGNKMTKKNLLLTILATSVIAVFAIIALMPFFFLFISSFKAGSE